MKELIVSSIEPRRFAMKCLVYFDFNGNLSYEVSDQSLIITSYNEDGQEIESLQRNVSLRKFYTLLKQYGANKHQLDVINQHKEVL